MLNQHPAARGRSNALARIESDGVESARAWLEARLADTGKPALDARYVAAYRAVLASEVK